MARKRFLVDSTILYDAPKIPEDNENVTCFECGNEVPVTDSHFVITGRGSRYSYVESRREIELCTKCYFTLTEKHLI
jgi:hypothetical protein